MGGKKRNADAQGKATINCSLNSLLATVEAIFNLGTLGRNDTSVSFSLSSKCGAACPTSFGFPQRSAG